MPAATRGHLDIISYGPHFSSRSGQVCFQAPTDGPIEFDTVTVGEGNYGASPHFDTGLPVNINTLTLTKGNIYGPSLVNVSDAFAWEDGDFLEGGDVSFNGSSLVQFTSSGRTAYRDFNNNGNFAMLGGFAFLGGRAFNNAANAVIDFQSDDANISRCTLNNAGMLIKSGGTGEAGVDLTDWFNTGTVDIQSGGISLYGTQFVQMGGETILSGGNFRVEFDAFPVVINEGVIKGTHSVIADLENTGGTVAPGILAGELTVDGDYTQGDNATLEIEIGGTNAGEYDVLTVTGTAALAGELHATNVDGFTPTGDDAFVILTATQVDGTFDTEAVPAAYKVVYNTTNVSLQSTLPSVDINGDGLINLNDFGTFQVCFQGSGAPPSPHCPDGVNADLDLDGDVDLDDYELFFLAAIGE